MLLWVSAVCQPIRPSVVLCSWRRVPLDLLTGIRTGNIRLFAEDRQAEVQYQFYQDGSMSIEPP